MLSFSLIVASPAQAEPDVTITEAANGENISADTAGGDFTELGPITITEGAAGDITTGNFSLTIPAGFEFDTDSIPNVAVTGADLAANTAATINATVITVNVTVASSVAGTLTIGGTTPIKVRPTAGQPLASGNITMTDGTIAGVTIGTTNFGTLTEVAGAVTLLEIIQEPTDTLVNEAIFPAVTVRATDQHTNNVTGQNITASLIGSGTLSGNFTRSTNASGIATFDDLKIDTPGPDKQLRFTATPTENVTSNLFNITFVGITVNPTAGLITTEDGGTDTFTIVLSSQPTDNVTIGLTSSNVMEGVVSAENVTFSAGTWNTPQVVTVTGVDDDLYDGNVAYTIITAAADSEDGNYDDLDASDVSVTNWDNDSYCVPSPPQGGLTDVSTIVTNEGLFTQQTTVSSGDNNVELAIDAGVTGLTPAGTPLSQILILTYNNPPPPPEQASVIGLTYDFRPDGATFDQPVTITFTYSPNSLPPGVDEEDLSIAFYDDTAGEWIVLDNITVDTTTHTITGETTHFTAFRVMAFIRPAAFAVSNLTLSLPEINIGEVSTVSVNITNTGDLSGTYDVVLEVDNVVTDTVQVTLDGHASQIVNFTVSRDTPGTYDISIGTLSVVLTVKELPTPTPTPAPMQEPTPTPAQTPAPTPTPTPTQTPALTQTQTPTPTPTQASTSTPTQASPSTPAQASPPTTTPTQAPVLTPAVMSASGSNWWLIGGIIGAVVIIAGLLWFWITHRRD